jgi:flagellar biosynthetic protein FlhB
MSRQELRDEHRESEGDPHVKARIRKLRRQRAAKRMMAAVPKATVVVTNPTHYAVALAYESGSKAAPRIVAKGVDELAARIREVAQDSRVPVVSNPPLARALYVLPLDSEIPREHFQVVAGIIAYVWKLRRPPPGGPPVR